MANYDVFTWYDEVMRSKQSVSSDMIVEREKKNKVDTTILNLVISVIFWNHSEPHKATINKFVLYCWPHTIQVKVEIRIKCCWEACRCYDLFIALSCGLFCIKIIRPTSDYFVITAAADKCDLWCRKKDVPYFDIMLRLINYLILWDYWVYTIICENRVQVKGNNTLSEETTLSKVILPPFWKAAHPKRIYFVSTFSFPITLNSGSWCVGRQAGHHTGCLLVRDDENSTKCRRHYERCSFFHL